MQNWRQYIRGNALRSYKYNIIDESIYTDIIKFNQFLDSVFNKLLTLDLSKISKVSIGNNTLELKHKQNIKCIEFENIDAEDVFAGLNKLLGKIGFLNFDSYTYNIVIKDGNCGYIHNSENSGEIIEDIRRKLIEKEIL